MPMNLDESRAEFDRAHFRAFVSSVAAFLSGRPNLLWPFDEVAAKLHLRHSLYRGVRPVELSRIVGSVDKAEDFDRDFHPRRAESRERWARIHRALRADEALPPVQLYQVGQAYFVLDGHHRISAAREQGQEYIDAEVIELPTPVDLEPGMSPRELILKAEQAGFLEQTGLDRLRPDSRLEVTEPGLYDVLLEHIAVHRYYLGLEHRREIPWEEAVTHWYDTVYLPIVQVVREQGVARHFPKRTEAELYVWVMDHRHYLSQETQQDITPERASSDLVERFGERTLWEWWQELWGR